MTNSRAMHVFFGATGDLAYKKIFPALQEIDQTRHACGARHWRRKERLEFAAAAGARSGQPRAARWSRPVAFPRLISLLKYVDGDYSDAATFRALRTALGTARQPAHYLAFLLRFSEPSSNSL